jgi:hypothetical protein
MNMTNRNNINRVWHTPCTQCPFGQVGEGCIACILR